MDKKPYVNNNPKTELCKQLAEKVYGSEKKLIKIDCSELSMEHDVSKLVGSSAGFVGYEEGGKLVNEVRNNPYSIVLFDEIEKAHKSIFNLLLQVLDEGVLTDGKGKVANFKNTIIIFTSNVGVSSLKKQTVSGFGAAITSSVNSVEGQIRNAMKKQFSPEFLNRLDDIIIFNKLTDEDLDTITGLRLDDVLNRLEKQGMNIDIDREDVIKYLRSKDDSKNEYGARPMKRIITKYIENELATRILVGDIFKDSHVKISVENDSLEVRRIDDEELVEA